MKNCKAYFARKAEKIYGKVVSEAGKFAGEITFSGKLPSIFHRYVPAEFEISTDGKLVVKL